MNREESREKVKKGLEQIKGMKWDKDTFLIIVLVGILLLSLPFRWKTEKTLPYPKKKQKYCTKNRTSKVIE